MIEISKETAKEVVGEWEADFSTRSLPALKEEIIKWLKELKEE